MHSLHGILLRSRWRVLEPIRVFLELVDAVSRLHRLHRILAVESLASLRQQSPLCLSTQPYRIYPPFRRRQPTSRNTTLHEDPPALCRPRSTETTYNTVAKCVHSPYLTHLTQLASQQAIVNTPKIIQDGLSRGQPHIPMVVSLREVRVGT